MSRIMGDPQPGPDYRHVHLQWFAEDETGGDEGTATGDESNVEDKVAELEKTLKNLQKDLAGKDRAINRLMEEKKNLESKKTERDRRVKRQTELDEMTAEELKREINRREEEIRNEYERELTEIKDKNRQSEYVQLVYETAPDIEGLHPFIIKALVGSREPDKEKIREVMESLQASVTTLINKNRLVIDNQRKVGPRPAVGEIDSKRIPTKKEWEKMTEVDRRAWSRSATDDQLKKFQESQFE